MFGASFLDEINKYAKHAPTFGDEVRNLGTEHYTRPKRRLSYGRMLGRSILQGMGGALIGAGVGSALDRLSGQPNDTQINRAVGMAVGGLVGATRGQHRSAVNQTRELYGQRAPQLSARRALGRSLVYSAATGFNPGGLLGTLGAKHSYENQLREHDERRRRK